jgi:hypothetical protein
MMTKIWNLPVEIQMVVGAHHQVLLQGFAHPLAATVCMADELAHELGVGIVPPEDSQLEGVGEEEAACLQSYTRVDRSSEKTLEAAQAALDLNQEQLALIRGEAEELLEKLSTAG